jgi:hypothetical protein
LQRLDEQARELERCTEGVSPEDLIAHERKLSHSYGGRSVFGWEQPRALTIMDGDSPSPSENIANEKRIEEEKLTRVPASLDLTPYRDEKDFSLLQRLLRNERSSM